MEDGISTVITDVSNGESKTFTFDHSYWYNTSQETVFRDLGEKVVDKETLEKSDFEGDI